MIPIIYAFSFSDGGMNHLIIMIKYVLLRSATRTSAILKIIGTESRIYCGEIRRDIDTFFGIWLDTLEPSILVYVSPGPLAGLGYPVNSSSPPY